MQFFLLLARHTTCVVCGIQRALYSSYCLHGIQRAPSGRTNGICAIGGLELNSASTVSASTSVSPPQTHSLTYNGDDEVQQDQEHENGVRKLIHEQRNVVGPRRASNLTTPEHAAEHHFPQSSEG
jgi:hypothetical protein